MEHFLIPHKNHGFSVHRDERAPHIHCLIELVPFLGLLVKRGFFLPIACFYNFNQSITSYHQPSRSAIQVYQQRQFLADALTIQKTINLFYGSCYGLSTIIRHSKHKFIIYTGPIFGGNVIVYFFNSVSFQRFGEYRRTLK